MSVLIPIGDSDFKSVVSNGNYFVDKTKFIAEIIDNRGKSILITRPRRFGKTFNLSMLYYYFTMHNADENKSLFHGTFIEQAGDKYSHEQGKWPVIYISFKDLDENSSEEMQKD